MRSLKAIREYCEKATPGPWFVRKYFIGDEEGCTIVPDPGTPEEGDGVINLLRE